MKNINVKTFVKEILEHRELDDTYGISVTVKFNKNTPEKYCIDAFITKYDKEILLCYEWEHLLGFNIIDKNVKIKSVEQDNDNFFLITLSDNFKFFLKYK